MLHALLLAISLADATPLPVDVDAVSQVMIQYAHAGKTGFKDLLGQFRSNIGPILIYQSNLRIPGFAPCMIESPRIAQFPSVANCHAPVDSYDEAAQLQNRLVPAISQALGVGHSLASISTRTSKGVLFSGTSEGTVINVEIGYMKRTAAWPYQSKATETVDGLPFLTVSFRSNVAAPHRIDDLAIDRPGITPSKPDPAGITRAVADYVAAGADGFDSILAERLINPPTLASTEDRFRSRILIPGLEPCDVVVPKSAALPRRVYCRAQMPSVAAAKAWALACVPQLSASMQGQRPLFALPESDGSMHWRSEAAPTTVDLFIGVGYSGDAFVGFAFSAYPAPGKPATSRL